MLKQILKDMFVDPEILAELPEEQKQILFFKIREEQIRRYYESQKAYEKKGHKRTPKKTAKNKQKVKILEDSNEQPWTWVMGEHPNDIPIEEIWRNVGNGNTTPATHRNNDENTAPVSKVHAIIFSRNKALNNEPEKTETVKKQTVTSANHNNNNNRNIPSAEKDERVATKAKPVISAKPILPVPKTSQETSTEPTDSKPAIPPRTAKPNKPEIPPRAPVHSPPNPTRRQLPGERVPPAPTPRPSLPVTGVPVANPSSKIKEIESDSDDDHVYEAMDEISESLPVKGIEEREWQKQLRQFKAEDERRKLHARRASMEVKRLSQQDLVRGQKLKNLRETFQRKRSQREMRLPLANRPSVPPKPSNIRPKHPLPRVGNLTRPTTSDEVREWFKETQTAEILASADDNNLLPDWFHGMISRFKAEVMLKNRTVGDYLIRVSEKIWGYALSYKDECKIKHFLIDASEPNCYHFFGNDQIRHPGLEQLIAYHQDEPISYGGEILKNPVGQVNPSEPDYDDIIEPVSPSHHVNKQTNVTAL